MQKLTITLLESGKIETEIQNLSTIEIIGIVELLKKDIIKSSEISTAQLKNKVLTETHKMD